MKIKILICQKENTKYSAAYDLEAAEDTVIPAFKMGMKPTLIKTGLKAYMMPDEVLIIVPRSSGPKKTRNFISS